MGPVVDWYVGVWVAPWSAKGPINVGLFESFVMFLMSSKSYLMTPKYSLRVNLMLINSPACLINWLKNFVISFKCSDSSFLYSTYFSSFSFSPVLRFYCKIETEFEMSVNDWIEDLIFTTSFNAWVML